MAITREELPRLNYLWIGPPRQPKADASGKKIYGSDVQDVIGMAKKAKNPVCFYCLDEHIETYKKIFKEQNALVTVVSVDAYLKEMKNHSDPEIQKQADKMIKMRNELLNPPRDRIVDRVTFKDAFALFLLAMQGGYTLDTSIKLADGKTDVTFAAHDHFKCPHTKSRGVTVDDCWMMYASPQALEEPRKMLHHYLSHWDTIQDTIRSKEREIDSIVRFHTQITNLIIDSINHGQDLIEEQKRRDTDWEFTLEYPPDAVGVAAVGKPKNLPIEKLYGNSHKPEYECREIVKTDVTEYLKNASSLKRDDRDELLKNLKESLKQYDTENVLLKLFIINRQINSVLAAAKELDRHATQLAQVSSHYHSKDDPVKLQFAKKIDQRIDLAYKKLNEALRTGKEDPKKVIESFKKDIKQISQDAKDYHAKKHPIVSALIKTRFETKTQVDEETPHVSRQKGM